VSQLVSLTGSQMQTVALHWHVYLLTRSPLALGALGLTRVLPIVLFSLWGGVAADRHDRRRMMFATQATMLAGAVALAALTLTGHESLALLYGANALLAALFEPPCASCARVLRHPLDDAVCAVFRKVAPTPEWLPRREGRAAKRPLGA